MPVAALDEVWIIEQCTGITHFDRRDSRFAQHILRVCRGYDRREPLLDGSVDFVMTSASFFDHQTGEIRSTDHHT